MPSGLKATEVTELEWPERVRRREPEAASQSLMDLSELEEARDLPSGLKATEVTEEEWPERVPGVAVLAGPRDAAAGKGGCLPTPLLPRGGRFFQF